MLWTALFVVIVPTVAYAAWPVTDATAIVKATEQLNKMQEQLNKLKEQTEWLTKLSSQAQDQIDAIGAMGKITLPFLNLQKIASKVLSDVQCLKPDLSELMPELRMEELKFGSICEGRNVYKDMLWYDPDKIGPEKGEEEGTSRDKWERQKKAREVVDSRREAIVKETASTGMAQGDLAATDTAKTNEQAVKDLETSAKEAEDERTRLAVIAQGSVLQNRQLVQQNQLLAQLLKVQSTMLMTMSVSAADRPGANGEEEDK